MVFRSLVHPTVTTGLPVTLLTSFSPDSSKELTGAHLSLSSCLSIRGYRGEEETGHDHLSKCGALVSGGQLGLCEALTVCSLLSAGPTPWLPHCRAQPEEHS